MTDRDDDFGTPAGAVDVSDGKGLLPKTLHKALLTGVSAVLMTEEGIRNAFGDMRLPKEAISYLVQQTERSRKDLFQSVSGEIKGFLSGVDFPGAIRKALTGLKVEVRADIRFVDDERSEASVVTTLVDADAPETPPHERTTKTTSRATTRKRARKTRAAKPGADE